jgi:predicted nucleotidyltransferase
MNQVEAGITAEIGRRLDDIEQTERVRIVYAAESGSRAWGFASPNSDYDVRFLYLRQPDWYLAIDKRRDVIELPLDGVFDINGWDIKKALDLMLKPNPVLAEWLASPIIYRSEDKVLGRLRPLAGEVMRRKPPVQHYLQLGSSMFKQFIDRRDPVALKKYFYVLRPALALRYLRVNPDKPLPMDLPGLRRDLQLGTELDKAIDDLVEQKIRTEELGEGSRIDAVDRFVTEELGLARACTRVHVRPDPALLERANGLFYDLVRRQAQ